ncbi:rRNA methyltransferase 1, mitochondrial-like isoform X2 [Corticium candelabrum]|uniref:rRNA methyltransferase 1, mitochondrial-like isoform X2 n=1 Tax=Corticium candelabrum TaxID=121492 RepID=UPI002E263D6E|nr:rRNA methyltransferase 1, mitochondrial-like isoform X2 [Corticium candelabrum]
MFRAGLLVDACEFVSRVEACGMRRVPCQIEGCSFLFWTKRHCKYFESIPLGRKSVLYRCKTRRSNGEPLELVFGLQPCLAALRAQRRVIQKVYLRNDYGQRPRSQLDTVVELAQEYNIQLEGISIARLNHISKDRPHQGVVLVTSRLEFEDQNVTTREEHRSLQIGENGVPALWVVLDEIQDPMNLGAILRTTQFLGVERVIVSRKNCAPLSPIVSKSSAGTMETKAVFAVGSVVKFLQDCALCGWEVLGSCTSENNLQGVDERLDSVEDITLHGPIILVLGNEGRGLRPSVVRVCSRLVTILPSSSSLSTLGLDSLNVSVAADQ